jgi:hypothetical protein
VIFPFQNLSDTPQHPSTKAMKVTGIRCALTTLILIFYEQSVFCCRCPESVLKDESVFCGQELQGSDCTINVKFVCKVGSVEVEKTKSDCGGRAIEKHCAPISRKHCLNQYPNPASTNRCLKNRGCYDIQTARTFWQEYNSTDPKFRFQLQT